jgi:hypothetical protein
MALRAVANPLGAGRSAGSASVNTTDDTATTLLTITLGTGEANVATAYVKAQRTGGSAGSAGDAAGYVLHVTAQNLAGTAEIIGQAAALTAEDVAGYNATFDADGATIRIRVTGVTDTNITWEAQAYIF